MSRSWCNSVLGKLGRHLGLSMKEAAAYVRWTYRTFREKWPKVPGLAAAHVADDALRGRHLFLSNKLDEYLEQRGAVKAARRGIGR